MSILWKLFKNKTENNITDLFFECKKCKNKKCTTYRYSSEYDICWPCGLNTKIFELEKYLRDFVDLR